MPHTPDGPISALNVLAVISDPTEADALADHLSASGHQVTIAPDGAAAIRAILDMAPDAVVMDLGLPGRDGYELARTLCYLLKTRPLLIALSDTPGLRERCRAEGFDEYLEKPADLHALAETLNARAAGAAEADAVDPLTGSGTHTSTVPADPDRRLSLRLPPKGPVRVTCFRGSREIGVNIACTVVDISEAGVRLVVKETLAEGEEVYVGVAGEDHLRPVQRGGRVAWCARTTEGNCEVGVHFHNRLDFVDVFLLT